LTAIVAVDADTGSMKWYYQTVPGDNWDYSAAMDITLGELEVDGQLTKVLLQAPKNGFFYVIDRTNGKLLRAHPYTEGITWATHVDMKTGRPVENPDTAYENNPQWILPANAGAHNWEPMSWEQEKGLMYFYYHDYANFYSLDEAFAKTGQYKINPIGLSLGVGVGAYRQELEKKVNPNWYPPKSILKEHEEAGDPLPKIVKPGPENPLGNYAMRLGKRDYLIHGTNKPNGIGMRISHGCIRLYPEDIKELFSKISLKTPVNIINQPYKIGVKNDVIYLEAHPFLDEDKEEYENNLTSVIALIIKISNNRKYQIDMRTAYEAIKNPTGLPIAVGIYLNRLDMGNEENLVYKAK